MDSSIKASAKQTLGLKKLSKQQHGALEELCKKIICAYEIDNWETKALECVKDFDQIESLELLDEVLEISDAHELDSYSAASLYHSKKS